MKYEDALQQTIAALDTGADFEATVARFPEHATRLRDDLALVRSARRAASTLPEPSSGRRARLSDALRVERVSRTSSPSQQRSWFGARGLTLAGAAAALLLLVVGLAFVSGGLPGSTAEASTIEGVVLDNNGDSLTLQTDKGVESVSVADGTSVVDASGGVIQLSSIEPGQVARVQGKRVAAAKLKAKEVNLRDAAALVAFCGDSTASCVQLESALQARAESCDQTLPACRNLRARIDEVRSQVRVLTQLDDLRSRCQNGAQQACRELSNFCAQRGELCKNVAQRIRNLPRD